MVEKVDTIEEALQKVAEEASEVRILKKSFDSKSMSGYIKIQHSKIGIHYIRVRRRGRSILLGWDSEPTIPITRINLLLEDLDLNKSEKKRLRSTILKAVYDLINREAKTGLVYKVSWFGAKIRIYEDHTVRIFDGNKEYKTTVDDVEEFKSLLTKIGLEKGYNLKEVSSKIEELFKELPLYLSPLAEVEFGENKRLKYADGIAVRLAYIKEDSCFHIIHVYGEWEEGDKAVTGVKTIVLKSSEDKVEVVEEPPFPVPEIIPTELPLSFIRNAVLDVRELQDLIETIRKINEGEEDPPSWREVYEEICEKIKEYVGAEEKVYTVASLFIMHCYFYDLTNHTVYTLVIGESGSGKRQLASFIGAFTRSISVSGASKAALQRIINYLYPVTVIDETEIDRDFALFLNRGYQKGLYVALVQDPKENKLLIIDPYSPKVIVTLPERLEKLPHDTENRAIKLVLVRRKGQYKREVCREEIWPTLKKLYLLMLYRWKEYLETYRKLDPIISEFFGGHDRDKWLLLAAVAYLVGEDVLKELLETAVEQYKGNRQISEKILKIIEGALRAVSLTLKYGEITASDGIAEKEFPPLAELCKETRIEENEGSQEENNTIKVVGVTPKAIVIANNLEIEEDQENGIPRSCKLPLKDYEIKNEAKSIGRTLARAKLPFVIEKRREGKQGKRFYYIELKTLEDYIKAYDVELSPDIDYKIIEEKTGIDFSHYIQLTPEKIIEKIQNIGSLHAENVRNVRNVSHDSQIKAVEDKLKEIEEEIKDSEELSKEERVLAPSTNMADVSDISDISGPEKTIQNVSVSPAESSYSYRKMVEKYLEGAEDLPKPIREALEELREELEEGEELNKKIKERVGVSEEEVLEFLKQPRLPKEIEERFGRKVWPLITVLRREGKIVLEKVGQVYKYKISVKPKLEASEEEDLVDYVEGLLREVAENEGASKAAC